MISKPTVQDTDSVLARATVRRKRKLKQKDWAPYVFLAPTLLFFVIFFLLPIGFSLYLSFTNWNPLSVPKLVGFENYRYILTRDPNFFMTLRNTLVFAFGTVIIGVPLALSLAFLFTRSRGKVIWRTLYFLPMVTNVAAIAYLWRFILDGTYGMGNRILGWFGIVGPQWLDDPSTAMIAVIIVAVWTGIGGNMLLFSAGLEGIDESYYEAARIDGATVAQEFWHVTLPLLKPTTLFVMVTSFIAGLSSFALILVMTNGGPLQSTNVTANYMYQVAFQNLRMGRASAMAYLLFIVIFVVTLIQMRIFRRGGIESY